MAETALVLPTLLLLTTLLLTGLAALDAKLKCNQLASSVARAIERDEISWRQMAKQAWPAADVKVEINDEWATVVVRKEVFAHLAVEGRAVALQRI